MAKSATKKTLAGVLLIWPQILLAHHGEAHNEQGVIGLVLMMLAILMASIAVVYDNGGHGDPEPEPVVVERLALDAD